MWCASRRPELARDACPWGSPLENVRHILLGLALTPDGLRLAPGSRLAADQARWLAEALGARVTLLHSTAADECWEERERAYVLVPDGLPDEGRRALDALTAEFREAGLSAELVFGEGTAWLEIVRRVLRDGVDLVVTGKRSDSERTEPRLGTVARKLLRECPCPVWVVKPGSDGRPRRILAATELALVGDEAVRTAASLAARCDAELHVAHALRLPFQVQFEGEGGEAEYLERAQRKARDEIARVVGETDFEGAQVHVALTAPTRLILECVERFEIDLAVLGTISRAGLAGLVVGNTAERLLDQLDCSLLAVKPEDFVCRVEAA